VNPSLRKSGKLPSFAGTYTENPGSFHPLQELTQKFCEASIHCRNLHRNSEELPSVAGTYTENLLDFHPLQDVTQKF
jgi:hypothetical protein